MGILCACEHGGWMQPVYVFMADWCTQIVAPSFALIKIVLANAEGGST